jgi:hypothetical protein
MCSKFQSCWLLSVTYQTSPFLRFLQDPTAPKRNASAFLLYSVKKRKEIKKINPNLKTTDISRKLGQLWRATSEDEKRPFVEREEIEREEYKQKMHAWKREKEAKESILTVTPTTPTTPTTPHDDADASATESERDSTENDSKQHSEIDAERILGRDMFTTSLAGVPEFSWEGEMQYHIRPRPTTNYCPPSHPPQSHATWWNETNRAHSANRHYNQHFYHHGPEQGYSPSHQYAPPPNHDYQRPIESRSMSSNPRYSPISLYRNDMDPIFGQSGPVFFPSPPMSRNEELDFLEDWKRNKSPSHLASRTSNAMPPKCSNPSSDNLVFKHDPVLDCFPIGSYDELDQSPIDTFQ